MNTDQSTLANTRNRNHVAERCHSGSVTCFRRVFKQTVSRRQIRWRKEASNKPEKSKFVYTIPAFQNGGPPSDERSLAGGGLHVQDRSSRCIFCNTDKSKVQEMSQIQIGGNPVRVSLPFLRTMPSTSDIYKIHEGSYCSTAASKYSPNNIPWRHADNGQVNTGIDLSLRHCDLQSVLEPSQKIGFLRMVIDSIKMEILLPQQKLVKLMSQIEQIAGSKEITSWT